jgi:signal transduction histidine kinase
MQRRARMLGASLTIERAAANGGTIVTCICPLDPEVPGS